MAKLRPFIQLADQTPGALLDRADLRGLLIPETAFVRKARPRQMVLL
jgi:hypothetical protein